MNPDTGTRTPNNPQSHSLNIRTVPERLRLRGRDGGPGVGCTMLLPQRHRSSFGIVHLDNKVPCYTEPDIGPADSAIEL